MNKNIHGLEKCIWKIVADNKGTTFAEDHKCNKCNGYDGKCGGYEPADYINDYDIHGGQRR